jgi:hypothetical protein
MCAEIVAPAIFQGVKQVTLQADGIRWAGVCPVNESWFTVVLVVALVVALADKKLVHFAAIFLQ